ncbi:MAG: glycoside hydrolase family 38 C-terminal domain-containing protein, partial [Candidatus Njordarchaeota archaeon]
KYIDKIYKRHKVCSLLFLYGRGDHGGGPTKKDIKNMRRAPKDIILLVEKAERFFSDIYEDINFSDMSIPKVEDELYLQFHRGVYTTQRIIKTLMRLCEVSILDTEFLLVLSEIYGLSREKINLEKIWKTILTNQFHDILSGALSKDATAESLSELKKALIKTEKVKNKIIRKIVNCFRKPREDSILIINPTQWSRDLIISLPNKEEFGKIANVPGFGVKIVPVDKIVKKGSVLVRDREKFIILENNKYRVFVDKRTGLLSQVFDKMLRKKLLKAPIRIRIFDDYPSWKRDNMVGYPAAIFDAWEIFTFDNESRYTDLLDPVDVAVEENNSLRAAIRTRYKYRQGISSAIFEICYVLDDASDSVGIEIKASWKSKHKLAKIILPLNTNTEYAIYGAPYGVVKRVDYSSEQASVAEKAKYEVPTVGWIQIPNKKWSISVAIDSSVGVSKDKSNLGITLLRSPTFPSMEKLKMVTLIPKCIRDRIIANKKIMYLLNHLQTLIESITKNYMDQGKHRISIKIKSYLGTKHTEAIKLWNELNRKCYVVRTEGEKFSSKIIEIIPKDVLISAIKPAEKDDGIILRLWNPNNSHKEARIILSRKIRGAYLCNGTEDIIKKLETTNNEIRIKIHKNQIKTIKII